MLNHKELMLGNWVYESERIQFPMQVVNIDKDMVYLDFDSNEGDVFEGRMKDIFPIPLTEEMLLKNGFTKEIREKGICYKHKDKNIEAWEYESYFIYVSNENVIWNKVKYVHQLQNILTIAGIEIDFKI